MQAAVQPPGAQAADADLEAAIQGVFIPGKTSKRVKQGTLNRFDLMASLDPIDAKANGVSPQLVKALANRQYSAEVGKLLKADEAGTLAGLEYILVQNSARADNKRAALSAMKQHLPKKFIADLEATHSSNELYGKGIDEEDLEEDLGTATRDEIYNLLAQRRVPEAYKLIQQRGVAALGKEKAHALLKTLHAV